MRSSSLPTTARRSRRKPTAQAIATAPLPAHLNFSFREWLRQRTELPRNPQGWTPLRKLYGDYLEWCVANDVPADYIHSEPEFSGRLRAHHDREPEQRKVQDGSRVDYALCFPRFLIRPIRVYG